MSSTTNAFVRSGLTFLGAFALVGLFLLFRGVSAAGVFNYITPVSPGVCTAIAHGLQGPEDFEVDGARHLVFVAAGQRRAGAPNATDGIYVLKRDDLAAAPVKLAGTPSDFHPRGISLFRASNGDETLMAINYKSTGRNAVEIFSVKYDDKGAPSLVQQSSVESGILVGPNDLAAISPTAFYVTNDHVSKTPLMQWLEINLAWPRADVLYFNGMSFSVAIDRIAFPNGVLVTPDGTHMYVTSTTERRLLAFSRDPFGNTLKEIGSISIPARLDNLSRDANGDLWTAGHASLPRVHDFQADPNDPSPSEVFRIHLDKDGAPTSYDTVYANEGDQLGAAASAAHDGKDLIIGSVLDKKMLDCSVK